jgi:hypothetical protein
MPTFSFINVLDYSNRPGASRTTSTYTYLTGASITSIANNTGIEIISDGTTGCR